MAFPTTPILDTMRRLDEGPPPSANWTDGFVYFGAGIRVHDYNIGDEWIGAWIVSTTSDIYWNPTTFGPDCEGHNYGKTGGGSYDIGLRLTTPGVGTTDGYMASADQQWAKYIIKRIDDGVMTELGARVDITTSPFCGGARIVGSTITFYDTNVSDGAFDRTPKITRTDSTYSGAGYIGFAQRSSNSATVYHNFGGGTIPSANFPATGVLDDFNRGDTGPPPSASWTGLWFASDTLVVRSNHAEFNGQSGDAYWNLKTFGPSCEAYVDLPVAATVEVGLRLTTPGNGTTDGYTARCSPSACTLRRLDQGVETVLGASVSRTTIDGDSFGARIEGSTLTFYKKEGGVWEQVMDRSDTVYTGRGYIGLFLLGSANADNFGGGTTQRRHTATLGIRRPAAYGVWPLAPILDDFNRANENPLAGNWTQGWLSFNNKIRLVGFRINENPQSDSEAYWNPATFGPDCDVAIDNSALAMQSPIVGARLTTPGAGTTDGYAVYFDSSTFWCMFYRIDNAVRTQLGSEVDMQDAGFGLDVYCQVFGLRLRGSKLSAYGMGGNWSYNPTLIGTRTDSTYTAAGYAGVGWIGNTGNLDNFRAVTL